MRAHKCTFCYPADENDGTGPPPSTSSPYCSSFPQLQGHGGEELVKVGEGWTRVSLWVVPTKEIFCYDEGCRSGLNDDGPPQRF